MNIDINKSQEEAMEKVKLIIMGMEGLSEEGLFNRYQNDPFFRKGFDTFVKLISDSSDKECRDKPQNIEYLREKQ